MGSHSFEVVPGGRSRGRPPGISQGSRQPEEVGPEVNRRNIQRRSDIEPSLLEQTLFALFYVDKHVALALAPSRLLQRHPEFGISVDERVKREPPIEAAWIR